jgi:hypothetical protein
MMRVIRSVFLGREVLIRDAEALALNPVERLQPERTVAFPASPFGNE